MYKEDAVASIEQMKVLSKNPVHQVGLYLHRVTFPYVDRQTDQLGGFFIKEVREAQIQHAMYLNTYTPTFIHIKHIGGLLYRFVEGVKAVM